MNTKAFTDLQEIADRENMIAPAVLKVAIRGLKEAHDALKPFAVCNRPWLKDELTQAERKHEPTCKHIREWDMCRGCIAAKALDIDPT